MLPGWPLAIAPRIDSGWSRISEAEVRQLAADLARTYPEAGRHYWAFRTWGLLVWQPVYLTMAGVHLAGTVPHQDCIGQRAGDCMVWGSVIADHTPIAGRNDRLLQAAAGPLRQCLAAVLDTCCSVVELHPKAAGRLVADCVTSATLRIMSRRPDWCAQTAADWGECWLHALGLDGAGGFLRYQDDGGGDHLAMERKVCCLVYKRRDGELCDTCPRIPLQERLAQLRRSASALDPPCP